MPEGLAAGTGAVLQHPLVAVPYKKGAVPRLPDADCRHAACLNQSFRVCQHFYPRSSQWKSCIFQRFRRHNPSVLPLCCCKRFLMLFGSSRIARRTWVKPTPTRLTVPHTPPVSHLSCRRSSAGNYKRRHVVVQRSSIRKDATR